MSLSTPRLLLRPFGAEDAAFVLELLNAPGWKRFIGDRGIGDLAAAENYISDVLQPLYTQPGMGLYLLVRKADLAPLGMCGLLRRPTLDDPDLGFALLERHQGQGYISEASQHLLQHARQVLGLEKIVAITTADNQRSAQLLRKLGFVLQGPIQLGENCFQLYVYQQCAEAQGNPENVLT